MATDEIMKETIRRRNQRIVDYKIPTEATTERVDQASAEQEKQPEMTEDLPVDSEDDIPTATLTTHPTTWELTNLRRLEA